MAKETDDKRIFFSFHTTRLWSRVQYLVLFTEWVSVHRNVCSVSGQDRTTWGPPGNRRWNTVLIIYCNDFQNQNTVSTFLNKTKWQRYIILAWSTIFYLKPLIKLQDKCYIGNWISVSEKRCILIRKARKFVVLERFELLKSPELQKSLHLLISRLNPWFPDRSLLSHFSSFIMKSFAEESEPEALAKFKSLTDLRNSADFF